MPVAAAVRASEIAALRALLQTLLPPEGAPRPALSDQRAGYDGMGLSQGLPEGAVVEDVRIGALSAERVRTPGADGSRALLYLHGGGYMIGSPRSHRHLAAALAARFGAPVLSPDYRLAPEHAFPAAVDDALAAFGFLVDQGVRPERIAIAGDSAGGGLAIAAAIALRDKGAALPGAILALSPWADLTQSGESHRTKAAADPIVATDRLQEMADAYLAGSDAGQPLASPALADLGGLPPLYLQTGSEEILLSDSIALAARAAAAQVEVRVDLVPGQLHVYPYFQAWLSDAREAVADAGAWLKARTGG
jgi:monoterpene epsilon-lactone hydrolase